uniref:Mib/herc2 domain-containing protein n=1 Tax=Trepomonas sp. PC1 TaxID=1076344 RepID=A0A146K2G2_9EUKA|eukprot:JAP91082.1 Mib/herc2 domain-containing protein [Trepomonas sp. PC1]
MPHFHATVTFSSESVLSSKQVLLSNIQTQKGKVQFIGDKSIVRQNNQIFEADKPKLIQKSGKTDENKKKIKFPTRKVKTAQNIVKMKYEPGEMQNLDNFRNDLLESYLLQSLKRELIILTGFGKVRFNQILPPKNVQSDVGNQFQVDDQLYMVVGKTQSHYSACKVETDFRKLQKSINLTEIRQFLIEKVSLDTDFTDERVVVSYAINSIISQKYLQLQSQQLRLFSLQQALQNIQQLGCCFANQINSPTLYNLQSQINAFDNEASLQHLKPVTAKNFEPGRFVVRNVLSWRFKNQDKSGKRVEVINHKAYLGRTVSIQNDVCCVYWYNRTYNRYACGRDQQYDIVYFDDNQQIQREFGCQQSQQFEKQQCACGICLVDQFSQFAEDPGQMLHRRLRAADLQRISKDFSAIPATKPFCLLQNKISQKSDRNPPFRLQQNENQMLSETNYEDIAQLKELFTTNNLIPRKQLQKQFLTTYAGTPVLSKHKFSFIVTPGLDWHHPAPEEWKRLFEKSAQPHQRILKLGVYVPSSLTDEASVKWFSHLDYDEMVTFQQKCFNIIQKVDSNDQFVLDQHSRIKILQPKTYKYDVGKDSLTEISGYEHLVMSGNFIQGALVGPTVGWAQQFNEIYGVLLSQDQLYCIVKWSSGIICRHYMGAEGRYELTYLEGM